MFTFFNPIQNFCKQHFHRFPYQCCWNVYWIRNHNRQRTVFPKDLTWVKNVNIVLVDLVYSAPIWLAAKLPCACKLYWTLFPPRLQIVGAVESESGTGLSLAILIAPFPSLLSFSILALFPLLTLLFHPYHSLALLFHPLLSFSILPTPFPLLSLLIHHYRSFSILLTAFPLLSLLDHP